MKKIFNILCVALVAVATFVSAGCSCSLSDKKIVEKVRALETTTVYQKGDELQNFKLTATTTEIHSGGTVTEYYYDASELSTRGSYKFTKTINDVEQTPVDRTSVADDDELNAFYNAFKTQPINAYGNMTNGKYNRLIGLEHAADTYLKTENISVSAKKKLFKDVSTFVIQYEVSLVESYRQTIVVNGDNKIIEVKMELVGTYVTDSRGNKEEKVYTIFTMNVEYFN